MIRYIWKFSSDMTVEYNSVFVVIYDGWAFVENICWNVCSVSWKYLLSVLHVLWGCYV